MPAVQKDGEDMKMSEAEKTGTKLLNTFDEFEVNHGSSIDLQFNEIGGWPTECAIFLYNSAGELVYSDGEGFVAPTTDLVSIIAD